VAAALGRPVERLAKEVCTTRPVGAVQNTGREGMATERRKKNDGRKSGVTADSRCSTERAWRTAHGFHAGADALRGQRANDGGADGWATRFLRWV